MPKYRIEYSKEAADDLRRLRKSQQITIADTIDRHLQDAPDQVTGSAIKRLDPPVIAEFRLRVGDYRVFYDVNLPDQVVVIAAIRFKGRMTLNEAAHDESD